MAHAKATNVTESVSIMTHLVRLGPGLSFSVFRSEVLQDPDEARKTARVILQE